MPINKIAVQKKLQTDREMITSWDYVSSAIHSKKLTKAVSTSFMVDQAALVESIKKEIGDSTVQGKPTKLDEFNSTKEMLAVSFKELAKINAEKPINKDKLTTEQAKIDGLQQKLNTLVNSSERELSDLITLAESHAKKNTPPLSEFISSAKTLVETNKLPLHGTSVAKFVWEFYHNEITLINNLLILIDSLDKELSAKNKGLLGGDKLQGDNRKLVQNYKNKLEETVNKFGDYFQTLNDMYTPVDKAIINIGKMMEGAPFLAYTKALAELSDVEPIKQVVKDFEFSQAVGKPFQHLPRYQLQLQTFLNNLNDKNALTEKDVSSVSTKASRASVESSLKIGKSVAESFNLKEGNNTSRLLAEQRMKEHGNSGLSNFVLRDILKLKLNSGINDPHASFGRFSGGYLNAMLAKAYPELFYLDDTGFGVKSTAEGYADILSVFDADAMGKSSSNPQHLKVEALENMLKKKDPDPLWLVLLTTLPVSEKFTAVQKIKAYADVAALIRSEKLGGNKYPPISDVVKAAFETVKAHPTDEAMAMFRTQFKAEINVTNPKSIGNMMQSSTNKNDYNKTITQMLTELNTAVTKARSAKPEPAVIPKAPVQPIASAAASVQPVKSPVVDKPMTTMEAAGVDLSVPLPPTPVMLTAAMALPENSDLPSVQQTLPPIALSGTAKAILAASPAPSASNTAPAGTVGAVADGKPAVKPTVAVSDSVSQQAAEIARKDQMIAELQAKNQNLSSELVTVKAAADKVKKTVLDGIAAADKNLAKAQTQLTQVNEELVTTTQKVTAAQDELEKVKVELAASIAGRAKDKIDMDKRNKVGLDKLQSTTAELSTTKAELAANKVELNQVKRELLSEQRKNARVEAEKSAVEAKNVELLARIAKLEADHKLTQDNKTVLDSIGELKSLALSRKDTLLVNYCDALIKTVEKGLDNDARKTIVNNVHLQSGLCKVVDDVVDVLRKGYWFFKIGRDTKADKILHALKEIKPEERLSLLSGPQNLKKPENKKEFSKIDEFINQLLTNRWTKSIDSRTDSFTMFKNEAARVRSEQEAGPKLNK